MNYRIDAVDGCVIIESWASPRRRVRGTVLATLAFAFVGVLIYLRIVGGPNLGLMEMIGLLAGYGFACILIDRASHETVRISAGHMTRSLMIGGRTLTQRSYDGICSSPVIGKRSGLSFPGTKARFAMFVSRDDAIVLKDALVRALPTAVSIDPRGLR